MQPIPFNLTPDSVTLIIDGAPKVFQKGTTQYAIIRVELGKDDPNWDLIMQSTTRGGALLSYLSQSTDDHTLNTLLDGFAVNDNGAITFKGEPLPEGFQTRASAMASRGEDPRPLLRFFGRLQQNPSWRSVQQLYPFLQHIGIPIEQDGTFLAYKGVRSDFLDCHSGTISNAPGAVIRMDRNKISDDADTPCHEGLHVGAAEYARGFGQGQTVICRVKPENVVCIPKDSSFQKMRVCEYEVVGLDVGVDLPDTVADPSDIPEPTSAEEEADEFAEGDEQTDRGEDYHPDLYVIDPENLPKKTRNVEVKSVRSLAKLTPRKLIDETIDSLRVYATHLKIVGASKLPGGKVALVKAIIKARRSK